MKDGWQIVPLYSLCDDVKQDIVDGPFGSELKRKDYLTEGVPVLKIQNIKPFAVELKKMDYVSPAKFQELKRHSYRPGDIVMTKLGSPLGVSAIVADVNAGLIVADLVRIRAQRINTKYLCYHLNSQRTSDFINSMQKGTTRPRVRLSVVRELPIAVPSPEEQERIVAILDQAFEGIASAKANAERNLQNARAIFTSHVQSLFLQRGEGWDEKPLVSLCSLFVDSAHRTPEYQDEGIPALRPRDVVNGQLALAEAARVSEGEYEIQSRRHKPAPGDIVYSRELSYGWAGILPDSPRVCLSQGMCLFRVMPDIDSAFLLYVLNGPIGREQATRAAVGSAHPHINLGDIKAYAVPFPPIGEQRRIVEQLDAITTKILRLEALCRRKLTALEALKKSLLQEAFTGQLSSGQSIQKYSTAVLYPATVPGITPTDLHAGILAMAYEQHEKNGNIEVFTHVKAEKMAHMIESRLGINLGRVALKDAAGPNDFPHLIKVEHRARKANFFDFKQVNGGAYRVQKLRGFEGLIEKSRTALGDRREHVERLLYWMLPMTVLQAEIVATLFAAWNNLLLEGIRPTDEQIVFEARENWHPDKLRISRTKFFAAVQWLRDQGVVPEGKGTRVGEKRKKM